MHKICIKYAKICSDPISISPMHSYAFICTKYANICKICKHGNYMQHMQKYALPTLLMSDFHCRTMFPSCRPVNFPVASQLTFVTMTRDARH